MSVALVEARVLVPDTMAALLLATSVLELQTMTMQRFAKIIVTVLEYEALIVNV